MIRAHSAAVAALITDPDVYVTRAPSGSALPYVVLHPTQGRAMASNLHGDSTWREWPFQTTCVGSTAEQAQKAAEMVEALILDVTPTVTGRTCGPIRKVPVALNVIRDETVQPPVFIARDLWAFASTPA